MGAKYQEQLVNVCGNKQKWQCIQKAMYDTR